MDPTDKKFDSILYHEYPEHYPCSLEDVELLEVMATSLATQLGNQTEVTSFQAMTEYGSLDFTHVRQNAFDEVMVTMYDSSPEYGNVITSLSVNNETTNTFLYGDIDSSLVVSSALISLLKTSIQDVEYTDTLKELTKLFSHGVNHETRSIHFACDYNSLLIHSLTQLIYSFAFNRQFYQRYRYSPDIGFMLDVRYYTDIPVYPDTSYTSDEIVVEIENPVDDMKLKYFKDVNDDRKLELVKGINDPTTIVKREFNNFSVASINYLKSFVLNAVARNTSTM